MVRRMKSELKLHWDGSRRFAERVVRHIEVPYSEAKNVHTRPAGILRLRLKRRPDGERIAAEFVVKLLKKRLFSCPAAFGLTLEKHRPRPLPQSSFTAAQRTVGISEERDDNDAPKQPSQDAVESALSPFVRRRNPDSSGKLSEYATATPAPRQQSPGAD